MLTRIQIRASGKTARDVEEELRGGQATVLDALGVVAKPADQFIEGTPGQGFEGRITFQVVLPGASSQGIGRRVHAALGHQPLDATAPEVGATKGKVSLR